MYLRLSQVTRVGGVVDGNSDVGKGTGQDLQAPYELEVPQDSAHYGSLGDVGFWILPVRARVRRRV